MDASDKMSFDWKILLPQQLNVLSYICA